MTTKHRPEWHEPVSLVDIESVDPLEEMAESGEVMLVDGPIDPVLLSMPVPTSRNDNFPRRSAGPMPYLAMPGREEAKDKVKDAVQEVTQKITATATIGKTGAQSAGIAAWTVLQRSPLQAIAVFASIIWLWKNNKTATSHPPVTLTDAAEKVGSVAGQLQVTAGNLRSQVQDQAQHGAGWFSRTLQASPLAIGAMALVFGAGLGFAVPETPYENSLLGETRDKLAGKAQEAAQDLGHKVQTVAQTAVHEAIESGKEEAKSQGLTA